MPPPVIRAAHEPDRNSSSSSIRSNDSGSATPSLQVRSSHDALENFPTVSMEPGNSPHLTAAYGPLRPQSGCFPGASSRSNRVSTSSLHSLNSMVLAGVSTTVSSSAASTSSVSVPRSGSTEIGSPLSAGVFPGQDLAIAAVTPKPAVNPVSVMTSSISSHTGSSPSNTHLLEPKDQPALPSQPSQLSLSSQIDPNAVQRTSNSPNKGTSLAYGHQDPTRSRSRIKQQRINGGTSATSQSPGSDAGVQKVREGREGNCS